MSSLCMTMAEGRRPVQHAPVAFLDAPHPTIQWNPRTRRFEARSNGQALRGVHTVLARCVAPGFDYAVARQRSQAAPRMVTTGTRGVLAGLMLDHQASQLVRSWPLCPVGAELEVRTFRRLCLELDWQPVASQLLVGCQRLRLATRLDVLCRDRTGAYLVLELKVGYPHWDMGTGWMLAPFASRTNCQLNSAQVQLAIGLRLFQDRFPQLALATPPAYLIRLHRTQADVYPVAPWATDGVRQLLR